MILILNSLNKIKDKNIEYRIKDTIMNTFLMFVILMIFIYEFSIRMKYITNNTLSIEKFSDDSLASRTYLPYNFSQNYLNNLNVKNISKDLGVKRTINQVKSATQDDLPNEFFKPLDINLFRKDLPKWTLKQRPWQESYTFLDVVVDQKNQIRDFKNKNHDLLSWWERMDLENKMLSFITPSPSSTPMPSPSSTPMPTKISSS
jgi:hypothetical protein